MTSNRIEAIGRGQRLLLAERPFVSASESGRAGDLVWQLITPEFPPQAGGVSDYTQNVAAALAAAGRSVHVWTNGQCGRPSVTKDGVTVHEQTRGFGLRGLKELSQELRAFPRPRRILVQYVPHGFGWKGINLAFVAWLIKRSRVHGDDVRVMFHEVAFPFVRTPIVHNLLAVGQRFMATGVSLASKCTYVSTPSWNRTLDRWGGRRPRVWLPIPSNIPVDESGLGKDVRARLLSETAMRFLIGHFGTFGGSIRNAIRTAGERILDESSDAALVLIGRGADGMRKELADSRPEQANRILAAADLPANEVSRTLQACDATLQPFIDGVSTRRTSAMASLANGVPLVSNLGPLSESVWPERLGDCLEPNFDPDAIAARALSIARDPERRRELGVAGRRLYDERFSLQYTIAKLLETETASAK